MKCQSIKNKKAEIHTVIDSAKPDIILGNESWLTPEVKKTQKSFQIPLMLSGKIEQVTTKVVVLSLRDLLCTEIPELDAKCEVVWCKLNIIGCRTLYLGSFYRRPRPFEQDYLMEFNRSLTRIMSNKIAHVLVGGD